MTMTTSDGCIHELSRGGKASSRWVGKISSKWVGKVSSIITTTVSGKLSLVGKETSVMMTTVVCVYKKQQQLNDKIGGLCN